MDTVACADAYQTPAADEDQASAGPQFGRTALLHPWKAAVAPPLSPSMRLGAPGVPSRGGRRATAFVSGA